MNNLTTQTPRRDRETSLDRPQGDIEEQEQIPSFSELDDSFHSDVVIRDIDVKNEIQEKESKTNFFKKLSISFYHQKKKSSKNQSKNLCQPQKQFLHPKAELQNSPNKQKNLLSPTAARKSLKMAPKAQNHLSRPKIRMPNKIEGLNMLNHKTSTSNLSNAVSKFSLDTRHEKTSNIPTATRPKVEITLLTPKTNAETIVKHKILAETSNSSKTTLAQSKNTSHQELNGQDLLPKKKPEPLQLRESRFRAETQPSERSTPREFSNSREDGRASRNHSDGSKIDIRLLDEGEQTQISFLQSKCLVPQTMDALNRSDSFKKTNPAEKKGIFVAKMLTHQEGQNKKPYHPKRVVIDPTYNQTKQGEKRDKDQSLINLESPQAKFRSNSPHEKKPFEINLHQKKEEIAVRQSLAEILRKPKLNCRPITVSKEESPDKVSKGVAGSKKQTFSIQKLKKKIQETTIDNLKDQNDKVQHKGPKPILNLAVSIKTFTPKAKETGPKPLFSHAQAPKAVGVSIRAKTPDKLGNYGHENPIANNKLPNQSSLLAHNRKDHRTGIKTPELSKIDLL